MVYPPKNSIRRPVNPACRRFSVVHSCPDHHDPDPVERFFLFPSWPDHYRVVVWPDLFRSLTFLMVLIALPCLGCWLVLRAGKEGNVLVGLASLSPLLVTPYFFWHLLPDGFPANFLFYVAAAVAATLVFLFLRPGKIPSPRRPLPGVFPGLLLLWTLCLVLFFWFGSLYFGHWAGDSNGDSGHFILQAKSLHQDHDLDIANNFTAQGKRLLEKLGPNIMHISPNSRNGHSYSWHGFGLALLLAPFFPLGSSGLHLGTACLAGLAALGILIASLLLGARRTTGFTLVTLFLLSAFWGLYSFQILHECTGTAGMIWLLVALLLPPERWRSALAITTMVCVLLPWFYVRYAPPAAIGAMFFLYKVQRDDLPPVLRKKSQHSFFSSVSWGAPFSLPSTCPCSGEACPPRSAVINSSPIFPGCGKSCSATGGSARCCLFFPCCCFHHSGVSSVAAMTGCRP